MKPKAGSFENNIDKLLVRLNKKKRDKHKWSTRGMKKGTSLQTPQTLES